MTTDNTQENKFNDIDKQNRLSLEKSLQSFRVLHTPSQFSWKQYWVNETFTHDDLFSCSEEEKEQFYKRLEECHVTICDNIKKSAGSISNLKSIIDIATDPALKGVNKIDRKVVYSSNNGERPIGKKAFELWGGFQVIDMDIKNRRISEFLKSELFERLKKYNWFMGIGFSSSGKGLHIWTKIQVSENDQQDPLKKKLLFLTNFRHKYSFVYLACLNIIDKIKNDDGTDITKDQLLQWMDLAMFKPQQGAFIGYDEHPLISTHFFEDFIYVCFDNVEDIGHPDVDWVSYPDLKEIFRRWEWFEEDDKPLEVEVKQANDPTISTHNRYHYKHFERWRLANTLVKLYGLEKGFVYLRSICDLDIPNKEIQADCITASRHNKQVDIWAINRLNKFHGFDIKVNIEHEEKDISELYSNIENIQNPVLIKESPITKTYNISKNEYLGHIKYQLLKDIGRITLIEAGAGTGKTEMVKSLVDEGYKVLLVMPFTSTIKSKVEGMKNWYYAYGNRKVKLNEERGVAMTIDKFSHLNLMEVKEAGFDYVIIDESHLMFQSEYRPVMPKVVEMIKNTEMPIIMMSGTPVGETVFFPDIVHLRIIKEDIRKKEFNVHISDGPLDSLCYMCKSMAKDISEGRRVLFPTNKGTSFKEQIGALVHYFLENDYFYFEEPRVNYYKKSNIGEEFMNDINFKKTISNTDILMCSTYLSVGVDILDRFEFSIYFNELWMPQEIEQFANRLRSHDLFINLYVNRKNACGESLNICSYKSVDFGLYKDELKDAQSILRICNAMIERNPIEYKYNSLVASIINNNKFIEYNNLENKYYLNDIAYKIIFFERKYRDYVQQLPVLVKGMMSYGYLYQSEECGEFKGVEDIKPMLSSAKEVVTRRNTTHIEELMTNITEDRLHIYKDVLAGQYDIRKGDGWYEDVLAKTMVVKNIEVFEKVIPLFVSMSKMYDVPDIKSIFEFCRTGNGSFNLAMVRRIKLLSNIVYNNKQDRLDLPIKEFMNDTYKFVKKHASCKTEEVYKFIDTFVNKYAAMESKGEINILLSPITMDNIKTALTNIFKCLVDISRPNKQKIVKLSKVDLMWKAKEEKRKDFETNTYVIDEFLDNIKVDDTSIHL